MILRDAITNNYDAIPFKMHIMHYNVRVVSKQTSKQHNKDGVSQAE